MKRLSEYGFNIYILDKTGKYIYRIFYETYKYSMKHIMKIITDIY